MKKIDKRVNELEKADFDTKFEHDQALKMNLVKRILNTPDENFHLSWSDHAYASLKINDNVKFVLYEVSDDAEIAVFYDGLMIDRFVYQEPYVLFEKEKQDSDCKLLRNKIKSIRELNLKVTAETEEYMSIDTRRFYAVFDAISGDFE